MRLVKPTLLSWVLLSATAFAPALSCGGTSSDSRGAGGTKNEPLGVCENPVASEPNGWVSCDDRYHHREAASTCTSALPRPSDPSAACSDADCAHLPYGHCWPQSIFVGPPPSCIPGCVSDDDCGADEICFCEFPVGRCIPADCRTDADCGPDAFCSTYLGPDQPSCSFYVAGAACQKAGDACIGDECNCAMVDGERRCVEGLGGCGPR